jgi:hypothetical protein
VDTQELLQSLDAQGRRLAAGGTAPDDLAKGIGLTLLALEKLLKSGPFSETDNAASPKPESFKAKSSRW